MQNTAEFIPSSRKSKELTHHFDLLLDPLGGLLVRPLGPSRVGGLRSRRRRAQPEPPAEQKSRRIISIIYITTIRKLLYDWTYPVRSALFLQRDLAMTLTADVAIVYIVVTAL